MKKLLIALALAHGTSAYSQAFLTQTACYLSGSVTKCFKPIDVPSGGTGLASGTSGGIPYFSSSTTLSSSAVLTANGIIYGGGSGTTPAATAAGSTSQVLIGGTPPSFGSVPASSLPLVSQSARGAVSSAGQLLGTNTNDSASAGNVGETMIQTRTSGSATSLTSNTVSNVTATKLTLTAGQWEIWGVVGLTGTATAGDIVSVGISTTSASLPSVDSGFMTQSAFLTGNFDLNVVDMLTPTPRYYVNISGNTDYYLVVRFRFAAGTALAYGQIQAVRVR